MCHRWIFVVVSPSLQSSYRLSFFSYRIFSPFLFFLFFFPIDTLASNLSPISYFIPLFFLYFLQRHHLSLSFSRRFRWYPIIPFLQRLFFVYSPFLSHTYIYTLVSFSILYIQVIPKLIAIRFVHSLKLDESFPPHFPLNPRPTPEQTTEGFRHLELPTSLSFSLSLHCSTSRWTNRDNCRGKRLFERIDPPPMFLAQTLLFLFFQCFLSMIRRKRGFSRRIWKRRFLQNDFVKK